MNKTLFSFAIKTLAIVIISLVSSHLNAQGNPGGPGGTPNDGSIPVVPGTTTIPVGATKANGTFNGGATVPFDGGLSLILAASGIGYAAKKLKRK